jgi:hypothetical protein
LTISYKGINGTDYPETSQPPTDYGLYEVAVSTVGDANHNAASATTTINIGQTAPVMSMTGSSKTYDGTPLALTAAITPATLTVTYSYAGTLKDGTTYPATPQAPSDAGDYTVMASTPGDLNYSPASVQAAIEIYKKNASITMNNKSTPYTGTPVAIDAPVTEPPVANLTITYKGIGGTSYAESAMPPTNGGSYEVKAVFAGNNNYNAAQKTANLTITDAGAPTLLLDNKIVTYNGQPQPIGAATIQPAAADYLVITYMYSNANHPASTTPPTDVGEYTVTASTPADNNFKAGQVTALLSIEQAQQVIDFPEPGTRQLGDAPFNAGASVNTGLPLTYVSGNTDFATVSADGTITILQSGVVTLTASQAGNHNYRPASLTRTLNITSSDVSLWGLTLNGQTLPLGDNMYFDAGCGDTDRFDIVITTETNATVDKGKSFTVTADKPGLATVAFTVTSQDGTTHKTYTLTIERRFPFGQIVQMRWNNTLTVINNPANNGGYTFTSYKWFRNGQEIGAGQSWSAGKDGEKLNPTDIYYVVVTANGITGEMRTCESSVTLRSMEVKARPNPVSQGQTLYVEADVDGELLEGAVIEVYNSSGIPVGQMKVQGRLTPIDIRYAAGIHFFKLRGKDGFTQTLKVIVK